jgi:hypothetical protein
VTDHGPVNESLARFVGCEAYGVESLRDDFATAPPLSTGETPPNLDDRGILHLRGIQIPQPNWNGSRGWNPAGIGQRWYPFRGLPPGVGTFHEAGGLRADLADPA